MKILRQHGDEAYHLMSVYAMDNATLPEKSKYHSLTIMFDLEQE